MKKPEKEKSNGLVLPGLPVQLESLNKEEDAIRTKSILHINAYPDLKTHLEIIHASLNVLFCLSIDYNNQTEDEQTIQFLGIRLFNTIVISLNLLLTGYYQGSAFTQRDILETGFLLDYFTLDPSKISEWRDSNEKERSTNFKPVVIRKALDARDGVKQKKREKRYKLFCNAAAHPTYKGFQLLAPNGMVKIGPFFNERFLKSTFEELVMRLPLFTLIFVQHFKNLPPEFLKIQIEYITLLKPWMEQYYGLDLSNIDTKDFNAVLELLQED